MKRYSWLILILIFILVPRLWADDTDIYGTTTISVTPNVLIIFDTSGSMGTADVPGVVYDPSTVYDGTYTTNAVYKRQHYHGHTYYTLLVSDYNNLNCSDTITDLESQGYSTEGVRWSDYSGSYVCSTYSRDHLYMGNWLNYDVSTGGSMRTRIDVAQEVIEQLITDTDNVRFGLMRFNNNGDNAQGGYVVAEVGTDKSTLISAVNNFTAGGYTPLAETLAEAGLYYAGKISWFNGTSGSYSQNCDENGTDCKQYNSPMQLRCQKNYIILMTDGASTKDQDSKLASGTYINGDTIGDYDNDGSDPGSYGSYGSDYLDDVAKYLYDNDLNSSLGTSGESFEKQNVVVYTIGFQTEQQLLSETAQNGGGQYYTANSISGLSAAFDEILSDIADVSAVFVSPVVPVSRMNRAFAGSSLYVGFFKPETDGRWAGNLKKYGIGAQGQIVDADNNEATLANGSIKDNARSFWSTNADGSDVVAGGIGGLLLNQAGRNLYTHMGTYASLTHASNAFTTSNTEITESTLDVSTVAEKESIIADIYGDNRDWLLGDILHSKPCVVHYDINGDGDFDDAVDDSFIFTGSNDGMIHCFRDSDGSEVWGFIPPDLLPRLKELSDGSTEHSYFVDGVPIVYEDQDTSQKILFFGERRGGNSYYALNVTTYNSPSWVYTIEPTFLVNEDGDGDGNNDGANALLGQSWAVPTVHTIKKTSGSNDTENVFLLSGGYDDNQDQATPNGTDSKGRAVFTINALTGTISKLNVNAGNYAPMTHSIVDAAGFDANGNGITNRVYAGDLGGNVFAFEDDDGDGAWNTRKFFSDSAVDGVRRKIFYSPDAVEESYGEIIYFGSGDRANPEGTNVVNRIYAIKNHWEEEFTTLTESDLYDATEDLIVLGTLEEQALAHTRLAEKDGWFIRLDQNAGEKVTSPVVVFNGVVYFTTYTPESGGIPIVDDCEVVSGQGQARLYALNYKTGEAAFEWSDIEETDNTDEHNVVPKGRWDRSKIIGTSIASAPVVAILEGGPQIYTGVQGGVAQENPNVTRIMETIFWRQLSN